VPVQLPKLVADMCILWPSHGYSNNAKMLNVKIGGTPEAVLATCALRCLGGEIQCKLWARSDEERNRAVENGVADVDRIFTMDDLVASNDVFFAATGITSGEFLKGVRYNGEMAETYSIMMRSRSGTMRRFETHHHIGMKRNLPMGAAFVPD